MLNKGSVNQKKHKKILDSFEMCWEVACKNLEGKWEETIKRGWTYYLKFKITLTSL